MTNTQKIISKLFLSLMFERDYNLILYVINLKLNPLILANYELNKKIKKISLYSISTLILLLGFVKSLLSWCFTKYLNGQVIHFRFKN